ncbi:MAG: hypothetical protein HUK24_02510 [Sphaerochaetaceae bacterium]|nr:hypothetical protein [Sphaerochaetaceae bacterium]
MIVKKIDMHVHSSDMLDIKTMSDTHLSLPSEVREMYDSLGVEKGVLLPSPLMPTKEIIRMFNENRSTFGWWFCPIEPARIENSESIDYSVMIREYKALGAKGISELATNYYLDDPKMLKTNYTFNKYNEEVKKVDATEALNVKADSQKDATLAKSEIVEGYGEIPVVGNIFCKTMVKTLTKDRINSSDENNPFKITKEEMESCG